MSRERLTDTALIAYMIPEGPSRHLIHHDEPLFPTVILRSVSLYRTELIYFDDVLMIKSLKDSNLLDNVSV